MPQTFCKYTDIFFIFFYHLIDFLENIFRLHFFRQVWTMRGLSL